uniref:Aminotransferase-like plant mobile domain-containing protein n=1 Tax=Nelumbo nucifera TaxID=4432 RepID=A0A822XSG8_NELNU|nr:TPA_asm: hypothetical protein HUJ06_024415 [Nelumbo nucifera]
MADVPKVTPIFYERTPDEQGNEGNIGPILVRHVSCRRFMSSFQEKTLETWTPRSSAPLGSLETLKYNASSKVEVSTSSGNSLDMLLLEKVDISSGAVVNVPLDESKGPTFYHVSKQGIRWNNFQFRCCAQFFPLLKEWTEIILRDHEKVLLAADIYGAVGVSRYSYNRTLEVCSSSWKGNCKACTFYMAPIMALGRRVSLAPTVLGYIYHSLNIAAICPMGPGDAKVYVPIHYVIAWLGEFFPNLVGRRPSREYPRSYPYMSRYSSMGSHSMSSRFAQEFFRQANNFHLRLTDIGLNEDTELDDKNLGGKALEFLICIRSRLLPVRVGTETVLEPYYPNRFARLLGYDQVIPYNRLSFAVADRSNRSLNDLAQAWVHILAEGFGINFVAPKRNCQVCITFSYARWWSRNSHIYFKHSMQHIIDVIGPKKKSPQLRNQVVLGPLKDLSSRLIEGITASKEIASSSNLPTREGFNSKRALDHSEEDSDIYFKRVQYQRPSTNKIEEDPLDLENFRDDFPRGENAFEGQDLLSMLAPILEENEEQLSQSLENFSPMQDAILVDDTSKDVPPGFNMLPSSEGNENNIEAESNQKVDASHDEDILPSSRDNGENIEFETSHMREASCIHDELPSLEGNEKNVEAGSVLHVDDNLPISESNEDYWYSCC